MNENEKRGAMTVKITSLEAENIKRIKAVELEPSQNGLTVIGGRNNQGKTSVLDAIAWALGGNKLKPSQPHRSGSVQDPNIRIELSNGLIVERTGKNSDLKVTDPTGKRAGQKILDSLIGELALNVPKFMDATSKEKASYLLQIIGVGDQLRRLEQEEKELATNRLVIGRQARARQSHADEMEEWPNVGTEEISAAELIQQQQEIMLRNAENARKRQRVDYYKRSLPDLVMKVQEAETLLAKRKEELAQMERDLEIAQKDALDLYDESTEDLEKSLAKIDLTNSRVRANREKAKAQEEARGLQDEYENLSRQIDDVRFQRSELLKSAPLPLPEMTVVDGEIVYKGQRWDNMSGSDQLKVSAAICRAMNPECGFVLLDKLEQMDRETLSEFGQWLESQGLQAIATRVSTGDECSIIIEDGRVKGEKENDSERPDQDSDLGTAWSW